VNVILQIAIIGINTIINLSILELCVMI
jgi:hypothetical protein